MPFLPAAMKNSTKASTFSSVASGSLRARAGTGRRLRLGGELRRVVERRAADVALVGRGVASSAGTSSTAAAGLDDDRERDVLNLAIGRQQRAVFAGRDELDADAASDADSPASDPRRPATKALCSSSRVDRHRAHRRRHPRGDHVELVALLEERLVARVDLQQRRDDLRRMAAPRHLLQQLAVARSSAAAGARASRRTSRCRRPASTTRDSTARRIRKLSSSRSSLM